MTRKINTRVKKQKGMLVRDRTTTKNTERIGKGVIDTVANMVLSSKHNRLLPGEKHMIIYLSTK